METLEYDVVIVGAGPSGLAAGIQLKQLRPTTSVCIVEKGSEVGAHIISGAVIEPRALDELIPSWKNDGAPLLTPATHDHFLFLTQHHHFRLPTPPSMKNKGNYIVSLGRFCQWLAKVAESLGVEIYPNFAATDMLYDEHQEVSGIIARDVALKAKYTVIAEGCRGSLTKNLFEKFNLRADANPQTYGIGIKELWEVDPSAHHPGTVIHSVGWPLDQKTYGGSFLYHLENNQVAVGFVVGLDYENPTLNPFQEFQKFKTHKTIRDTFKNGRRIGYGARAISEGGLQSLPTLSFPGGLLIGDTAGFLNVPKIKGTHLAMKSGMVAAETIAAAFESTRRELKEYKDNLKNSWIWKELYQVRNIRPAFRFGLLPGLAYAAVDTYLLRGHAPWTFKNHADHLCLKEASACKKIIYPKPDGVLTFDILSSVYLSNTHHKENQPCHLQLKNPNVPIEINLAKYDAPEQYYCPAAVYEILKSADEKPYLQINSQNCIHCKTCDIKDPTQNINWVPPEGGDGPNYQGM